VRGEEHVATLLGDVVFDRRIVGEEGREHLTITVLLGEQVLVCAGAAAELARAAALRLVVGEVDLPDRSRVVLDDHSAHVTGEFALESDGLRAGVVIVAAETAGGRDGDAHSDAGEQPTPADPVSS